MKRQMMRKTFRFLAVYCLLLLAAGCLTIGSARIGAQHFAVDALERAESGKSYAEAAFDIIAEGDSGRRVVGWTDVKT